ncbi:hypothetical protein Hypma_008984 [Hypsizygus marmoreus]|uniref:PLC-like phosphodiesterase n=1 Tax=Hypsizygus marmoreus TaxID=39966 RepID=A0A369JSZ9_HYPMA|nr:hypothetical protein Hypma_008984 [Hypsizygus marmoreus]
MFTKPSNSSLLNPQLIRPVHVRDWMHTLLPVIGNVALGDVCMPKSHDAGMWYKSGGTRIGGTANNILTQTQSIYQQLHCGARMFDIRPVISGGKWVCGHYTHTGRMLGWQGGNGASIAEVIKDVNHFADETKELIIIEVSHSYNIDAERSCNDSERADLLDRLSGFHYIYQAANPRGIRLDRERINNYIGGGKSCVLVVFAGDEDFNPEHLAARGFYINTQLPLRDRGVCRMQTDSEAIDCTLGLAQFSVLNLTKAHVLREFPVLLQHMANDYPSTISIDDVHNVDAVTFAVAVNCFRNKVGHGAEPVVVYGGRHLEDPGVRGHILFAILHHNDFVVSNENLGGDPLPNVVKSCAVYYQENGLVKGRFAWEGQPLRFSQDIHHIVYGGVEVTQQGVYNRFYDALTKRDPLQVHNTNLGGDPLPGVQKTCTVEYTTSSYALRKRRTVRELETFDFDMDILSVEYGDRPITDLGVIESMFKAMKDNQAFLVNNLTMGGDPKPGVRKVCKVRYMAGKYARESKVKEVKEDGKMWLEAERPE